MKTNAQSKARLAFAAALALFVLASCGKGKTDSNEDAQLTSFEVRCLSDPPPPPPNPWDPPVLTPPLPNELPSFKFPITVGSCSGLGSDGPQFFGRQMPGFAAVVNCTAKTVRFQTRDWQIDEVAGIGPTGNIDAHVIYITRLVADAQGNSNCWARLLGHIAGHVTCPPGDSNGARVDIATTWTFDETPPEVMEPPSPGLADLRNGKHCVLKAGNCSFSNNGSFGCGG